MKMTLIPRLAVAAAVMFAAMFAWNWLDGTDVSNGPFAGLTIAQAAEPGAVDVGAAFVAAPAEEDEEPSDLTPAPVDETPAAGMAHLIGTFPGHLWIDGEALAFASLEEVEAEHIPVFAGMKPGRSRHMRYRYERIGQEVIAAVQMEVDFDRDQVIIVNCYGRDKRFRHDDSGAFVLFDGDVDVIPGMSFRIFSFPKTARLEGEPGRRLRLAQKHVPPAEDVVRYCLKK